MSASPDELRAFVDTNILLYAISNDPRSARAGIAVERADVISVQVLNEFANTARRKMKLSFDSVREAELQFRILLDVVPLTLGTHDDALRISERYGFGIHDSLIVATALEAGCSTLYTEDLQHGQIIDGTLKIINPFV